MKRYELLVLDWDGTLVDSANDLVRAMQQAIQGTGLPERSPSHIRSLIGLGVTDILARLFPDRDPQYIRACLSDFRRRYGSRPSRVELFESVRETLDILREQGFSLAVATGKSRSGLENDLAATGLRDVFAVTRCADESASKPAPDMLNDILLHSATLPGHALMVGDTSYDMSMARAAGVDAVGVSSGVHAAAHLSQGGAIEVLDSVAALPEWLTRYG